MKKKLSLVLLLITCLITCGLPALSQKESPLFQSKEIISLQATGSIKSIKKNTNDSTFVSVKFHCETEPGKWIEVPSEVRVRGNFRLRYCYFPPLKLKFEKVHIEGTIFEGNKSLKLVMPCRTVFNMNELIRREYLCYQFYETMNTYHFQTRLAKLTLTEESKRKPKTYELLTFLVEDNSKVAKRSDGKIMEVKGLSPLAFDAREAVRNDYFQYMIGNADWSSVYQHNTNVLYADKKYITLSYDFDMSGFVNAPYAKENPPKLGTGDPRERVYRGFCREPEIMEEVRQEYLTKKDTLLAIVDRESANFQEADIKDMKDYLQGFFDILTNDQHFKNAIIQGCRTDN